MCYTMELINVIGIERNERSVQVGIDQGLENIFCKRPDSEYYSHRHTYINDHGYLWTMKFEFHVTFTYYKIFF